MQPWLCTQSRLDPSADRSCIQPASARRGISLMEVLISMFILSVGLLGAAALLPAGRHEIVEAYKLETAAMVGRNAIQDLQIRGYLNPANWVNHSGNDFFNATSLKKFSFSANGNTTYYSYPFFAIDPLGIAAGLPENFPQSSATNPLKRIRPRMTPDLATADIVFRPAMDLIIDPNATNKDLPPTQRYFNTSTPDRRASDGNYTWLATITQDATSDEVSRGSTLNREVTVSVVVFHKRNLSNTSTELAVKADSLVASATNKEWELTLPTGHKGIRPGQWIMLSATDTSGSLMFYRWYRAIAAGNVDSGTMKQQVTLAGRDWNPLANTKREAFLFENIVSVYEKHIRLELE